ncbi:magnesium/cobalt efflux protein [Pseudidiomarina aestuarii]|uniref:Magnesium/cobalt efflux protein n=1 Tax=Pseudidiomarina aestuarii TaxID=624146 RepID=A0A2T4D665_9GAMM|nr:HlyC/CorC family transporter [Pseudidiomarina aestuarii]PTB83072.1 magnesium/cobalt efflux protein [Pseudidiomarina aestuarii]PTB85527.1 magnesium/cobalt efflux protein [Pseudidiomarina aestuarii]PTB86819.1 magnesium/cobalt efflux protein [Pseudidiomarina aestuarii]PTB89316.1 magnesium/cobalt efflux protein [Pseudidiomarina aestuarii]RUO40733.1 magnesium/cobalt efflux protein [Pseudidiomarina aestuarii]
MDDIATSTLLIILGVLLFLSAYFSGSETGMMSINRYRLRHLVQQGHRGAKRVQYLLDRPDRLIGLILIGNNLVNIAASAVATIICLRWFGDAGLVVATFGLTLVVLIFSEVTPKTIAALHPERVAFPSSIILKPLLTILYPAVASVNFITNGFMRMLGVNPNNTQGQDALSSEELRTVVNEANSMIPTSHQEMLLSILDLEKVTVEDVMIPRAEISGIDVQDDVKSIIKQLSQAQYTRILLYRNEIDDAIGFIHARDIMQIVTKNSVELDKSEIVRSAREIYYIPEGTPLNVQLLKFQRNKERIGLVVDEYGDIQGLVTLEDILEEIVGDFTTTITPLSSESTTLQPDGSVLVDGVANIRDLNKEMNWNLPIDGPKTVSGLVIEVLGDIPQQPLCLTVNDYRLEIVESSDNMVRKVRFFDL